MPIKKCQNPKVPVQYEYDLQKDICQYIRIQYPDLIFTSDLSGIRLPMGLAVKTAKLRSSRAIPDLLIFEPRHGYHGLFIELKRPGVSFFKKDGITPATEHYAEQWEMINRLLSKGYLSTHCNTFETAKTIIDSYLSTTK